MRKGTLISMVALVGLASAASAQVLSPVVDRKGDAQDPFGAGPPLLDIDVIDVRYDAVNLYYRVSFHAPISPPSAGQANSAFGFLEFDTDQNQATGAPPTQNFFDPPFVSLGIGVDYLLFLVTEQMHPGEVDVVDSLGNVVGTFPIVFGEMHFEGSVPLATLRDDGIVNFTTILGTFQQPTDAMDVYGISVPVPGTACLMLLGSGVLVLRRRREDDRQ